MNKIISKGDGSKYIMLGAKKILMYFFDQDEIEKVSFRIKEVNKKNRTVLLEFSLK